MKTRVELDQHTCDGCGKVYLAVPGDELPHGYHGHHIHVSPWGGDGGEWFACGKTCIVKAIGASEDRANSNE